MDIADQIRMELALSQLFKAYQNCFKPKEMMDKFDFLKFHEMVFHDF
jgi:hypothetical protein